MFEFVLQLSDFITDGKPINVSEIIQFPSGTGFIPLLATLSLVMFVSLLLYFFIITPISIVFAFKRKKINNMAENEQKRINLENNFMSYRIWTALFLCIAAVIFDFGFNSTVVEKTGMNGTYLSLSVMLVGLSFAIGVIILILKKSTDPGKKDEKVFND